MSCTSLFPRFALLALVWLVFGVRTSAAQTVRRFSSQVISSLNTTNPGAATGSDPTTQAQLRPTLLAGAAALKLGFPATNPAGSKAGLLLKSGDVLALSALSGLVINTYLAPSTTPQESVSLSQLLTLQVLNSGPAAAEFTTAKPFDQIELATGGVVAAYTLGLALAYADVPAPLPVELVAFTGQATLAGVQLRWQTATELHSSYFAVERAASLETGEFAEIGRVAAAGASSQARSYQFVDTTPGLPLGYYRLRQVDTDGQAHYSPVVAVRAAASTKLTAYPSPATTRLYVASPAAAQLQLLNSQGQLMQHTTGAEGQQGLDISNLPAGVYFLREAATGQGVRFVKAPGQ